MVICSLLNILQAVYKNLYVYILKELDSFLMVLSGFIYNF